MRNFTTIPHRPRLNRVLCLGTKLWLSEQFGYTTDELEKRPGDLF